jgi:hypothetical protein
MPSLDFVKTPFFYVVAQPGWLPRQDEAILNRIYFLWSFSTTYPKFDIGIIAITM